MTSAPGARRKAPVRRRRWPGVAAAAVAAAVVVTAVVAAVGLPDDGEHDGTGVDPRPSGSTSVEGTDDATDPTSGPATPSTSPTDPGDPADPTSPVALDERFAGLARSVTSGFEECRRAKARDGQRDRFVCETPRVTLELVTYDGPKALDARRDKLTTFSAGEVLDFAKDGNLVAHAEQGDPEPARAFLYRDVPEARQSATYFAEKRTDLDDLVELLEATTPSRPYPAGPSGLRLIDFADPWVEAGMCLRIPTVNDGAMEESYCDAEGEIELYVGRFRSAVELSSYRRLVKESAVDDERDVRDWSRKEGGKKVGAMFEYTTDAGARVRYWDDPSCSCYAEAFLPDGEYADLRAWWVRRRG